MFYWTLLYKRITKLGCSAHGLIDQFLLLFPKDNSSKSVHPSVTHSCKVSEGLRPSQKDPFTGCKLQMICSGHKRGIPLKIVGVNEIVIFDDLAPKFLLWNATSSPQNHDTSKSNEIQRDPSLMTRANMSKIRVFKWILLRWSESLWKRAQPPFLVWIPSDAESSPRINLVDVYLSVGDATCLFFCLLYRCFALSDAWTIKNSFPGQSGTKYPSIAGHFSAGLTVRIDSGDSSRIWSVPVVLRGS